MRGSKFYARNWQSNKYERQASGQSFQVTSENFTNQHKAIHDIIIIIEVYITGLTNQQRVFMLREYVKSQFKYNRQKIVDTFDHHYSDLDKRNDSKQFKHKVCNGWCAEPIHQ